MARFCAFFSHVFALLNYFCCRCVQMVGVDTFFISMVEHRQRKGAHDCVLLKCKSEPLYCLLQALELPVAISRFMEPSIRI